MILLPAYSKSLLRPAAKRLSLTLCLVAIALLSILPIHAQNAPKFTPDVLVLVLGGVGPSDMVSINYTTVVALPTAQADLDTIAKLGGWQATNAQGNTKSSGGPNPKPTTSITFLAKGIIGYGNGTLPLEPFVTALKRFKNIEVGFITPAGFQFKGLKDFKNEFVKIELSPSGNTYRYRIVVKDNKFSKLDLPLVQPEKTIPEPKSMPVGARVALAVGVAALGAALVYLIALYLSRRRI